MDWISALFPLAVALAVLYGLALLIGRRGVCTPLWLVIPLFFAGLLPNLYVWASVLIVAVLGIARWCEGLTYRNYALALAVTVCGVFGIATARYARYVNYLDELRAEYPLQSIAHRLAYEAAAIPAGALSTLLSTETQQGLEELRQSQWNGDGRHWQSRYRDEALLRLHKRQFDEFAEAAGFGIARGFRVTPEVAALPAPEPIALQCPAPDRMPLSELPPPELQQLQQFHWISAGEFLDAGRIGYVQDRDHVAGFQGHAFSTVPEFHSPDDRHWQIVELALVSLLKHPEPCVYETEFLPNMQELSSATVPTRPLDDFEADALPDLRSERDLVIDDQTAPSSLRMLGALRAGQSCLECHQVPHGALLGAFTYRLNRFDDSRPSEPRPSGSDGVDAGVSGSPEPG